MAYRLATYSDKVERTDLMDVLKTINFSPTPWERFGSKTCPNCKKEYKEGEKHNCMTSLRNLLEDI